MKKRDLIIIYYAILFISSLVLSEYNIIYSEAIFYFAILNICVHILVTYLYVFIKELKYREKWFFRIGVMFIMLILTVSSVNIFKNYMKDYINYKSRTKLYNYVITKDAFNYYLEGSDENLNKYKLKLIRKDAIKVQQSKNEYIDVTYYKNTNIVKFIK